MKGWAVVRARFKVTGMADFENTLKYHYDSFFSTEIVRLFDYEQEATDYLIENKAELSRGALATIVEVENITQW